MLRPLNNLKKKTYISSRNNKLKTEDLVSWFFVSLVHLSFHACADFCSLLKAFGILRQNVIFLKESTDDNRDLSVAEPTVAQLEVFFSYDYL